MLNFKTIKKKYGMRPNGNEKYVLYGCINESKCYDVKLKISIEKRYCPYFSTKMLKNS